MPEIEGQKMRLKAQNFVEIALLAGLVAIIAIVSFTIINNRKIELTKMSAVNVRSVNLNTASAVKLKEKIPYNSAIETAGAMSLEKMGMNASQYDTAMANITYEQLKNDIQSNGEEDIASLANDLITELNLPYNEISADNISANTLASLTGILNEVSGAEYDNDETAQAYIARLNTILSTALANSSIGETGGSLSAGETGPGGENSGSGGN